MAATRPGSNRTPARSAGQCDRVVELVGRHRGDGERGVAHDRAEDGVLQRPVEEIGSEGGDDADVVAAGEGGGDAVGEPVADRVGGHEGPELFELVDDDHERAVAGGDVGGDVGETVGCEQPGADVAGVGGGDASERDLELDERVGAGHHRHHQCVASTQCRHDPRVHQRALPGPGRADHEHERVAVDAFDERVDECRSALELGGVGFTERPQTLVGVDRPERQARQRARRPSRCRFGRQTAGGSDGVGAGTGGGPGVDELADVAVPVDRDRRRRLLQHRIQRWPMSDVPDTAPSGGSDWVSLLRTTSVAVAPANGACPVSASHATTASEYWSDACPATPSRACSGLAYSGEPAERSATSTASAAAVGDPEVGEVAVARFVEQHVGRLHVTVHDPQRVRGRQRATDLADHPRHLGEAERAVADPVRQRPAAQQSEHQERRARLTPVVVQGHHVRVLEAGHQLRFGLEPLHEPRVVGQLGPDRLDRHLATEARLHRPVDRTERALADQVTELVAGDRDHAGRCQRRVADQDLVFEVDEHARRVEPGLVGQVVGEAAVGPQCFGLATRQVQRPHLQRDELLAQRLFGDQPLQVGDRFRMEPGRDQPPAAFLVGDESEFLQPRRHRRQPPLRRVITERPTRPQRQRMVVGRDRRRARRRPRRPRDDPRTRRRRRTHRRAPTGTRWHRSRRSRRRPRRAGATRTSSRCDVPRPVPTRRARSCRPDDRHSRLPPVPPTAQRAVAAAAVPRSRPIRHREPPSPHRAAR